MGWRNAKKTGDEQVFLFKNHTESQKTKKSYLLHYGVCAKALLQKCRIYFLDKSKEMDIFIDASIAEIN